MSCWSGVVDWARTAHEEEARMLARVTSFLILDRNGKRDEYHKKQTSYKPETREIRMEMKEDGA